MPRSSGISAGDSRELSVSAQFPMMAEMERDHGSLVRAMFAQPQAAGKGPSVLLRFDRGMGTLTGALAAGSVRRCGRRAAVRDITRAGDGWRVGLDCRRDARSRSRRARRAGAGRGADDASRSTTQLAGVLASITYAGIAGRRARLPTSPTFPARSMATAIWSRGPRAWRRSAWCGNRRCSRAARRRARRCCASCSAAPAGRTSSARRSRVLIETARRELAAVLGIRADPRHTSVFALAAGHRAVHAWAPRSAATTSARRLERASAAVGCAARRTTACRSTTRSRAGA